ncbi:olfactory receptor 1038-like [Tachyglossus aculeatus]|uniref:olfactory receptor 1038-like n=1 Tax=Tachyglossus aculeatus TaxID=9261 RepID=UPI0018F29CDC|nr:olfactory receptor 1038-like [Tachyglossus aculeatus]
MFPPGSAVQLQLLAPDASDAINQKVHRGGHYTPDFGSTKVPSSSREEGLSDRPEVRFAAFGAIYTATLLANGALLLALRGDHHLHTPMYFLLTTLSLLDVFCPMAAGKDVFLLTVTASEHRLAVVSPLHYAVLMDGSMCVALAYYYYVLPVTGLSALAVGGIGAFSITLGSYVLVAGATVKSRSAEEKRRTWSTCTSCLPAVSRFYGPAIITYIRPSCCHYPGSKMLVGMLYGVLNPLIDSLRNEEVKAALRQLLRQTLGPLGSLRHP